MGKIFTSNISILAKVENKGDHFHHGKVDFHTLTDTLIDFYRVLG